jgi:hypothetical protein
MSNDITLLPIVRGDELADAFWSQLLREREDVQIFAIARLLARWAADPSFIEQDRRVDQVFREYHRAISRLEREDQRKAGA